MSQHLKLGKRGEEIAAEFLLQNNYEIIQQNFKAQNYELDIIAKKDNILIFVEVKTRNNNYFGEPEESVNHKKEKHITKASELFMNNYDDFIDIRFDIIAIILQDGNVKIKHIEDAFSPKNF